MKATYQDGFKLCKILYPILKSVGVFPALTGGLLYKDGDRKDIDIVFYRHRQDVQNFEVQDLSTALSLAGVEIIESFGFVTKAKWRGFDVDILNPETRIVFDEDYGES